MKKNIINDQIIQQEVSEALRQNIEVNRNDLTVVVDQGHVHIQGEVASRHQKKIILTIAEKIPGVKDVQGPIKVKRVEHLQGVYGF